MSESFRPESSFSKKELIKNKRLTRQEAEQKVAMHEHFESCDLTNLDLTGLPLAGKKFCSAEAAGLVLYHKSENGAPAVTTDISHTDWTGAALATENGRTNFIKVVAEGARFGYTKKIAIERLGETPQPTGPETNLSDGSDQALFGFNGSGGNFQKTSWKNINFGGDNLGAYFKQADFREAVFEGCDLSGIDLSTSDLEGVLIKDPVRLEGLIIAEKDVLSVAQGLSFSTKIGHDELEERAHIYEGDPGGFLDRYGVKIVR